MRILLTSLVAFAAYAVLLNMPQPLFAFEVRADHLVLYSDRPFSEDAGQLVLRLAHKKLARSPLYTGSLEYNVFICNSRWRQVLFFNRNYGVGGVAPYLTSNVFLRDALVESNRLLSRAGQPVAGDRTLDYFVAHELTHRLTERAIGPVRSLRLPHWVREGYADYIAKADAFHYDEARQAFLAGAAEMDWRKSGLYWRFHLLVAYVLDHQHLPLQQLLLNPPSASAVEDAIRAAIR